MTIADFSIKRPVFAWMLMSALIIFGAIGLSRLGVSQMPDVDFPVLNISVTYTGASSEIMEAQVVEPIESRIISVEGLKEIRSTVRQGSASVNLEFDINRNIDSALQEVQAALSRLKLPDEIDPPTIRKQNPEDDPILFVSLISSKPLLDTIKYVDLTLQNELQTVPGVGEVFIGGYSTRNLRIWVDNNKLKKNLLTVLDVATAVNQGHSELPSGFIEDDKTSTNVRAMGEALNAEAIGNLWIRSRGGETIRDPIVRIRDVAKVEDGLTDIRRISSVSGKPGIGLGIRKQRGSNEVAVANGVKKKVEELNKTLPEGYKLQINVDFTQATEQIVETTMHKLLFAAFVTGIICFMFLGSWSSSINVILSIPTSILGTFVVMYFAGFTLNLFTLLALTLVISIVVDDAIMMLENIVRHFKLGKSRVLAASEGAREITTAAVAATVAVIAIFLPVVFMQGIIGKFFFQFGITISTAVLLSLVEAVTLTPMRCAYFMRKGDGENWIGRFFERLFHRMAHGYQRMLRVALNWRWSVIAVSTILFGISLYLFVHLRKEFVPTQDQSLVIVNLTLPVGTALSVTEDAMKEIEAWVQKRPEVVKYMSSVGSSGGFGDVNSGNINMTLVPREKRSMNVTEFGNLIRKDFKSHKEWRLNVRDISSRGLTSGRQNPVAFNIRGNDYKVLSEKSQEIMDKLTKTGLVTDIDTDYKEGQPELQIRPRRQLAADYGVTPLAISSTISAAVGGLVAGQFTSDGRRYDIRISLPVEERRKESQVNALQVRNYAQELVPIDRLINMETVSTTQSLTRIDRQRAVSVFANLSPGGSQGEALAAAERIAKEVLPEGYSFNLEGAAQTFNESFTSLYYALALGILVAYMVLASQFNSFIHPISILLALPFSISGAFLALWMFNKSLNLYSMIGILLLMGIAKKNSILLVEFTNHVRAGHGWDELEGAPPEGTELSVKEAMLLACPVRLRPILMTSAATVVAAMPLAIDSSPGWEARMPMALAIIGGNIISTMFTLFVVPCAYHLMSSLERPDQLDELETEGQKSERPNGRPAEPKPV